MGAGMGWVFVHRRDCVRLRLLLLVIVVVVVVVVSDGRASRLLMGVVFCVGLRVCVWWVSREESAQGDFLCFCFCLLCEGAKAEVCQ